MDDLVDDLFELHLKVLSQILIGTPFSEIRKNYSEDFNKLDYEDFITNKAHRLSFDKDGNLIGAYPVSPIPTDFKITISGVYQGYAMCALDALGIAYTFMGKTVIETKNQSTGNPVSITVDPLSDKVINDELVITYPNQGYTSLKQLVAENTQLSITTCPNILFYSKNKIPINSNLSVLDFEDALDEAIAIFSQKAMKEHFQKSME
ncbi:MAG: hypothetical protein GPJ54_20575 [Candidatus Heimdallarchaeota archaeon]|nr:hypothetical protein [Candidatus Heimdallarchaeota archaeon]